jgi:hypothetical protein
MIMNSDISNKVGAFVGASVWDSVGASVWDSVENKLNNYELKN